MRFVPILLATATVSAEAAQTAPPTDRLLVCTDLTEAIARLTCFDREMAPLVSARRAAVAQPPPVPAPSPAPASVTAPVAPAPPAAATAPTAAQFGQEQLKSRDQDAEPAALHARIASSRRGGQGTYLLTLDNGQVWRHEEGSQVEYLKVGEAVTITRAAMGSYRLNLDAGNSRNWVRVTRVR
jgi:hypothetical protein